VGTSASAAVPVASARSIFTDILNGIGKGAVEVAKRTANRYRASGYARAAARTIPEAYAAEYETGIEIEPEKVPFYRSLFKGKYPVYEAGQNFLKKITRKAKEFVYGANREGTIFIDEGISRTNPQQREATGAHELTHSLYPRAGEEEVEATGLAYAIHLLRDADQTVREKAALAYRGFIESIGTIPTIIEGYRRKPALAVQGV
jgi:hypothetical protein